MNNRFPTKNPSDVAPRLSVFESRLARISHEFWIEAVEWCGGGLFLQRERYSGFFETLNGHPGTRAAIFARTSRAGRDHGSGWRFWFDTRRAFSATQGRAGGGKEVLPRISATETDPDTARGDAHLRGDFQQPQPDGVDLGFRPFRAYQAQPPQGLDQHIGQRGEVQPQLIGPQRLRAHAVREQAQLLLDAIFHFAARAIELLIKFLRGPVLLAKGSHQVARIFLALDLFRFGDHPPCPRPALLGAISELAEHPRRFSRAPVFLFGLLQGAADDPPQTLVARKAKYIVHRVAFAPRQQFFAAKAGVRSQDDAGLRPPRANLPHDALYFFETPGAGVDVRGPQPHAQQMIPAEHVQRQIAVVSVVAVKKTRFLPSVQRRVGGVQVQHDLPRRLPVRFQKKVHQQFVERFGRVADLGVAFRAG